MSPSNKPLMNFVVDQELLDRLDDFRFKRRFPTRAGAIKYLLDWALAQDPDPAKAPASAKQPARKARKASSK